MSKDAILAIVGCRNYSEYSQFKDKMNEWVQNNNINITTIVSGGATGADSLAEKYANENGIPMIIHNADWKKHGKAAGPMRNTLIVNECDMLIAFPSKNSKGTWNSVNKAKTQTKHVTIFNI
jgi:hypothetical protein